VGLKELFFGATMPTTQEIVDFADTFNLLAGAGRGRILITLLAGPMITR
jgi:hypothetical protein